MFDEYDSREGDFPSQEEAHYYWTLTKFEKMCEEEGVARVLSDLAPFIKKNMAKWFEENT